MTARQSTHALTSIAQRDAAASLILVVDPDPDTQAMYASGLVLLGWTVDGVSDGREALAKAISGRPVAIVTETCLPRLDGFELCRLLRRDPDTRHIPVLVVTGDTEERRIAAVQAGADCVLSKPCVPDELAKAIEAALIAGRDQPSRRAVTAHTAASNSASTAHAASKRYERSETTRPPSRPPALFCPGCGRPLSYQRSYVGGVSARHREQWDLYKCSSGCGQFQYRQRTRKLREAL